METLLLKIILCSSVLIGLYYLFLEREKTFRFNRFYLLLALVFSYVVPFITIKLPNIDDSQNTYVLTENLPETVIRQSPIIEQSFNWTPIVLMLYGMVTFFLFIRMILTIIKINKLKGNELIINKQTIKILDEETAPFSFLNTIYMGKKYVENNKIDERILLHEKNHIDQKHSWDLLFIEFLKIVSWFNPALYFYKKAIITNHEFLADESVINQNIDVKTYKELILSEIMSYKNLKITNQFNFNNTKKRFIMMTKQNTKFAKFKMGLSIPVLALLFVLFTQRVNAEIPIIDKPKETKRLKPKTEKELKKIIIEPKEMNNSVLNNNVVKDTIRPKKQLKEQEIGKIKDAEKEDIFQRPIEEVDELPEFPGGLNEFRKKVSEVFDPYKMNGNEGIVKAKVIFKIDTDGQALDYSVEGNNKMFNNEALRALQLVNKDVKWKPAMKNEKPVGYVYTIPLTMLFEERTMNVK